MQAAGQTEQSERPSQPQQPPHGKIAQLLFIACLSAIYASFLRFFGNSDPVTECCIFAYYNFIILTWFETL